MDDKRIIVLLARKAAGEISIAERDELIDLLAHHPDAVYYEEFVRELWEASCADDDTEAYYEWHKFRHGDQLPVGNRQEIVETTRPVRFTGKRAIVYLAMVIAGTLGLWLYIDRTRPAETSMVTISAQKGTRKQFRLPDGTDVWLNADSRLSYNADMGSGKLRKVQLQGEAYFDVAEDKNRPFSITTDVISIKVLGTAFNVKAYPDDPKTEATLIRGSILLSVNNRPDEKIVMKPNEKVAVVNRSLPAAARLHGSKEGVSAMTMGNVSKIRVADEEYIEETSWVENKLVFRNETLGELIPKFERWFNVD